MSSAVTPQPLMQASLADKGTIGSSSKGPWNQSSILSSKSHGIPALYATPSFNSICAEDDFDDRPGPGAYESFSSLGNQTESHKKTFSSVSFKNRNVSKKQFLTKHHLSEFRGRDTPGPGSCNVKTFLSKRSVAIGKAQARPDADSATPSPGPAAGYHVRTKVGDDLRGSVKIGKELRWKTSHADNNTRIGPGSYECGTSIDGKRLSKSFGNSFSEWSKNYVPAFERFNKGTASPGPGKYHESFGKEGQGAAFTKDTRGSLSKNNDCPGPAAYRDHNMFSTSNIKCFNSLYRSKPGFGFGKPPTKNLRSSWVKKVSSAQFQASMWGL